MVSGFSSTTDSVWPGLAHIFSFPLFLNFCLIFRYVGYECNFVLHNHFPFAVLFRVFLNFWPWGVRKMTRNVAKSFCHNSIATSTSCNFVSGFKSGWGTGVD